MHPGRGLFRQSLDVLEQLGVLLMDEVGEVATVVEDHVERLAILKAVDRLLNAPIIYKLTYYDVFWNTDGRLFQKLFSTRTTCTPRRSLPSRRRPGCHELPWRLPHGPEDITLTYKVCKQLGGNLRGE